MPSATHAGGCLCGAIRFEAAGDPRWVAHCHCADCRKATASPFTTYAGYMGDSVRFTRGELRRYASSEGVLRSFCGECGTSIAYEGDRWPGELHLFACTFDDAAELVPQAHVYTRDQLPWVHLGDGLPRKDTTSG